MSAQRLRGRFRRHGHAAYEYRRPRTWIQATCACSRLCLLVISIILHVHERKINSFTAMFLEVLF